MEHISSISKSKTALYLDYRRGSTLRARSSKVTPTLKNANSSEREELKNRNPKERPVSPPPQHQHRKSEPAVSQGWSVSNARL